MPRFDRLVRLVAGRLDGGGSVPLLALRLPVLEAIAWRDGLHAARVAERCAFDGLRTAGALRAGDALAHRLGSDRFAVALLAPARDGRMPDALEARVVLRRVADAAARATGHRVQSGWCTLRRRDEVEFLGTTIDAALERGLRERERADMLALLGHELRTPIGAIGGYLETLLAGDIDPHTAHRFLKTARRETLRLGRLAEGLLAISLLDAHAATGQTSCEVGAAIAERIEGIAPLARRRRVAIRADVRGETRAAIDADACGQALSNLLDNALKWAASEVLIGCARYGEAVTTCVDDDGPGIAPADRERVFAPGVRGAARDGGGAGIGLALVRAIARRAGGDAFAAVSPRGGTRLVLRLRAWGG